MKLTFQGGRALQPRLLALRARRLCAAFALYALLRRSWVGREVFHKPGAGRRAFDASDLESVLRDDEGRKDRDSPELARVGVLVEVEPRESHVAPILGGQLLDDGSHLVARLAPLGPELEHGYGVLLEESDSVLRGLLDGRLGPIEPRGLEVLEARVPFELLLAKPREFEVIGGFGRHCVP